MVQNSALFPWNFKLCVHLKFRKAACLKGRKKLQQWDITPLSFPGAGASHPQSRSRLNVPRSPLTFLVNQLVSSVTHLEAWPRDDTFFIQGRTMITGSVVPKLFFYFLINFNSVAVIRRFKGISQAGGKNRWGRPAQQVGATKASARRLGSASARRLGSSQCLSEPPVLPVAQP